MSRFKSILLQGTKFLAEGARLRLFGKKNKPVSKKQLYEPPAQQTNYAPYSAADKRESRVKIEIEKKEHERWIQELKHKLRLQSKSALSNRMCNILVGGKSPIEREIRSMVNETGNKIYSDVIPLLHAAECKWYELMERKNAISDETFTINFLTTHNAEKEREFAQARKLLSIIRRLEKEKENYGDSRQKYDAKRQNILETYYEGLIPQEVPNSVYWGGVALVMIFSVGEGVLVYDSLFRMSDNTMGGVMMFITATSIMIALISATHQFGKSLNIKVSPTYANKNKGTDGDKDVSTMNWQTYLPCLLYGFAVLTLFSSVAFIRFSAVADTAYDMGGFSDLMGEEEGGNDYLFIFMNLGFLLLVTGMAKYLHRHEDYFNANTSYNENFQKENEVTEQIEETQTQVANEERAIDAKYLAMAGQALQDYREKERADISGAKQSVSTCRLYLKRTHKTLSDIYFGEIGIGGVQNNIIYARRREKLDDVSFEDKPIEPLDFHEGVDTSEIYANTQNESPIIDLNVVHASKNGKAPHNFTSTFSIILALIGLFLLPSCTEPQQKPIHKTVAYVTDWSISRLDSTALPTVQEQLSYVFKLAEFRPTKVTPDKVDFITTTIATTSFAPTYSCELSAWSSNITRAQRKKMQRAFAACVYDRFTIQNQHPEDGLDHSFVGAALNQVLPKIAQSKDSIKIVFTASDMIINSRVVNFYKYGHKLIQSYDVIVKKLEKAYPDLKNIDLEGVQLYATYLPDEKTDRLAEATRAFWTRWVESKNGQIEFLSNLPKVRLATQ